jgi:predicted transcriptional regulator
MSWSAILPLVGVLLGTTATLVSQYLSTRLSQREAAARRTSDQRAERKAAIVEFLDAAQRVEHLLDRVDRGGEQDEHEAGELMHRLWLSYKCAEIICSAALGQTAQEYSRELHHYVWDGRPEGPASTSKREARYAFLDAAAKELDPNRTTTVYRRRKQAEPLP